MKNITTNSTNDIGMVSSLIGCAALSIAVLANAFAAPAMPVQKMETIVVTANRLSTISLEPMIITAKRVQPTQMAQITFAPIVVTAQRVTV